MKRLVLIMAFVLALAGCGEDGGDGNNNRRGDYQHNFTTGTYEVTDLTIDGAPLTATETYLIMFSIDRTADRLVMIEALHIGREVEFDYRANNWNYSYSRWDQDFDSCDAISEDTITCTEWEDRRTITYTIEKLNNTFDASIDLLSEPMNGTATINGSYNDGTYGLVAYDGVCHVEGELVLTGSNARYDLDLERGCPIVRELEARNAPVTVGGWANDLLTITVDGVALKFKKISDINY